MSKTIKSNGEGSVFQVAENKWVAKIYLGTSENGKPIIKQFSGQTEAIVKKKLRDFRKSENYIAGHLPTQETAQAYFTKWLREYQYNKLKPSSYDRLEATVKCHILPWIGKKKMDKVTRDDIQALINRLYYQSELSYSSVKKVYVALNACYKHAIIDDIVIKNPCSGIILPSQSERTKQPSAFLEKEVEILQKYLSQKTDNGEYKNYYAPAFLLILHTGMRMGEALSLTWDDIDLCSHTVTVRKNSIMVKNRDNDGVVSGGYSWKLQDSTKTTSGNRTIPINKTATEALHALLKGNNTPYVIVNSKGKPVLPSNFERSFHAILRSCELDHYSVHSLRHTFASRLFRSGVDVKIISKFLGHSSVKITYDIYVHLMQDELAHVTDVLDDNVDTDAAIIRPHRERN